MNFKYSVIGDNTQENREWLEKVGYAKHGDYRKWEDNLMTFSGDDGKWYYTSAIWDIVEEFYLPFGSINCIGNPQLFQAVSAISTKTDIGKHYINNHTGQWKQCTYEMATDENIDWSDWTEATLTELQERFKEKEYERYT